MNNIEKKIGIIGGGQLGKMMILEAKRLGFYVTTLDPTFDCPSHSISDEHIVADFHDKNAIFELAQKSDVITYEFEHINVQALSELEEQGKIIYPSVKSLRTIQNKYSQKQALAEKGILVPRFGLVCKAEDIYKYGEKFGFPLMLKTCKDGYDGKGNYLIKTKEMVQAGFDALYKNNELMVEEFISFEKEISILATRGINKEIVIYPVGHNIHENSILDTTIVPAGISAQLEENAKEIGKQVMNVFDGVGTFCVEMFVKDANTIYVNEVAPRPHNSGHYTIEGCRVNQFENHIRAVVGLPLGDTSLICPVVMINLLGQEKNGKTKVIGVEEAYKITGVNVHVYGKKESKIARKMGHFTVTGNSAEEALDKANKVRELVKIIGCPVKIAQDGK
ncbi:MAG: 5-(carboxyamino)imidazole ribonucleotide synthase [Spirochaetes bacterium]|nr:5-(carboxyamino)imidazole ribonucleotide synthase [Spirochaetota bacterium]